jgi:phage-related protein
MAGFEVSGINTNQVMAGMQKGLVAMAKAGEAPADTLQRVTDEIANMEDPVAATALAVELFGSKAGPEMASAIRSGQFDVEEYLDVIANGESTIAGTADATDDWREKLATLKNRVLVKLKPVAEAVFSAITTAAEKLSAWVEQNWPKIVAAFGWFSDHKDVVIAAAAGIGAVLVTLFGVWAAGAAAAAAATLLAIAPFVAVGVAIAAVAAGVVYAYQHFETFRTIVDGVARFLRDEVWPAIQAGFDLLVEGGKAVVAWFREHWDEIKAIVSAAFDGLVAFVTPIFQAVKDAAQSVVDWIRDHWARIKEIARAAWDGLGEIVGAAIDVVKAVIGTVVDFVKGIFDTVKLLIHGDWSAAWDKFKEVISTAWDNIGKVVKLYLEYVKTIISKAWPLIRLAAQIAWDNIRKLIAKAWDVIKLGIALALQNIRDRIATAWEGIQSVANEAWARIKDVMNTAWEGVKLLAQAAVDWLREHINTAWEAIKTRAQTMWTAIKTAIGNVWENIKTTIKGYYEDIKLGVSNAWESIKTTASNIWTDIKTAISDVWEGIKTTVSDAVGAVTGFVASIPGTLRAMVGDFLSAGASLGSAIIDGLGNGLSSTANFLSDIGSAVRGAVRTAWNSVVDRINSALEFTIHGPLGISFTVNPPNIPHMHSGGVVPGRSSDEMLAILQGGETVLTANQMRTLTSPGRTGRSVRDVHIHNHNLTMTPGDLAAAIAAAGLS